ncbi:MAG: protein O-mannosyl-transferase family [Rhodosalinus sp.]
MTVSEAPPRIVPDMQGHRTHPVLLRACIALGLLAFWAAYYAWCLFPGLGGVMNAGDTAKFQTLAHSQILVHGPGYPMVLFLGAVLRALDLPVEPWRAMTFAMAALPGAVANMMAFLIVARVTRSLLFGIAGSLLLGSAGLMAVQSTEAEVYPLALAFVLSTTFLLVLFLETRREGYFLAACGVYALSFGNHLMMIMLVPLGLLVMALHWRRLGRPRIVASVIALALLGASQYLYLAYVTHHPDTAYSEYLPLPPTATELIRYISGTYFSGLYGSGLSSTYSSEMLLVTLRSAHPWISAPLIVAGVVLFAAGWRRRDADWIGVATVFAVGLSFIPFMIWYGAYDIQAFHLPVLGPLLIGAVAAIGWWSRRWRALQRGAAVLLIALGVWRVAVMAEGLTAREPIFTDLPETLDALVAQAPIKDPVVSMTYGLRMATLYHEMLGEAPQARYRVPWRAEEAAVEGDEVAGLVVPTDGEQLLRWIEHRHPDLACRSWAIDQPEGTPWPAYAFSCARPDERDAAPAQADEG